MNSSLIDIGRSSAGFRQGVCSGPLLISWNLYVNELDEVDLLRVALACVLFTVRKIRSLVWAWFWRIIAAFWDYLLQDIARVEYIKVKKYQLSILGWFSNRITKLLGKDF